MGIHAKSNGLKRTWMEEEWSLNCANAGGNEEEEKNEGKLLNVHCIK